MAEKQMSAREIADALAFVILEIVVAVLPESEARSAALITVTNRLDDAATRTAGGCQAILANLANALLKSEV